MPKTKNNKIIASTEQIAGRIYFIRGRKVMLDQHLAELYRVETRMLNQSVRRNIKRFPSDFMFQLTVQEFAILRSQFVISNRGGRRYLPYVFTEQGVAMLSSALNSEQAIQVNIQIMRVFTKLRTMLMSYKGLKEKIEEMESKYDRQFKDVFEAIKQLIIQEEKPRAEIGFK